VSANHFGDANDGKFNRILADAGMCGNIPG